MSIIEKIPDIVKAYQNVTALDSTVDSDFVVPYSPIASDTNQFVFFLKPEASSANLEYILNLSLTILTNAGVKFGAVRILGGPYLDKHNIMGEHYGVISKISKEGVSAISDTAREKLSKEFSEDINAVGLPVGGHQFLKINPDFSPLALYTINDNIGTTRLAGGTYLLKFKMLGKVQLVLNPFHAYQLVPFVRKGSALVLFECSSNMSWADLRTKLCGVTNPLKAEAGSIRAELLRNASATGMPEVNLSSNGCHMSAGPLEGLVELKRFLNDHDNGKLVDYKSLAFGAHLASLGLGDELEHLATNPDVSSNGKMESVFDLTEEKSFDESGILLKKALGK